ncbi:hypothetical protein J1614_004122 [Plenodomus biglobosus]|nr:hypothetical protein J1614_004122 [Plenodomus biglobosus]
MNGGLLWWFHSRSANGRCEKHQFCIDALNLSNMAMASALSPAREIEEPSTTHAYVKQLAIECINLQWHLEALEHRSEHAINRLYNKYNSLEESHSMLQHDHGLLARKHDRLIDVATGICEEIKLHANCIYEVHTRKPHAIDAAHGSTHREHGSTESKVIPYRSQATTPIHEINLPDINIPIPPPPPPPPSHPAPTHPQHMPLVSPTSPAHNQIVSTSETPQEPKLVLKLRGLKSAAKSDSDSGSVESRMDSYITPPTSALTGPLDGDDKGDVAEVLERRGDGVGTGHGGRRRASVRVSRPSRKRRAEIYVGGLRKRGRPCV